MVIMYGHSSFHEIDMALIKPLIFMKKYRFLSI
jgi:hypothetical protein